MRKTKILYVITKSNFGGAQRYVFDLATHLPKDRFDVAVALGGTGTPGSPQGRLAEKLHAASIRTIPVTHFGRDVSLCGDLGTLYELVKLFRSEHPDVVHLNSAKAATIGALAARIACVPRIVTTVHGWASHEPRPWWQRILIHIAEWIGVRLAHTTIVVAEPDARLGTVVIQNGIATDSYVTRSEARNTLHIPQDAFAIGTIGELTKNKNFSLLIKAVVAVETSTPLSLTIIGDGEDWDRLRSVATSQGLSQDILVGAKDHAARYLPAFDLFVLPSHKEGLPYVLLEAGSARVPVIASRVGGIPEIVTHNTTGLLISPDSLHDLTQALLRYIENPKLRETHAAALYEHIHAHFSLDTMVEKTAALYTLHQS